MLTGGRSSTPGPRASVARGRETPGPLRASRNAPLRRPPGPAEQENPEHDERHAQYLSRVHPREDNRSLLGELQDESGEKHPDEKQAAEGPLRRLPLLSDQEQ